MSWLLPRMAVVVGLSLAGALCIAEEPAAPDVSSDNKHVGQIFRASPKDVLDLRKAMEGRQDAMYAPLNTNITPRDEMVVLGLTPEESSPTVNLNYLSPSVVQIFDATGAPWPISDVAIAHKEFLGGRIVENDFGNSVILFNLRPQGQTFLTLFLKGLPVPVNVRVIGSDDSYHRNLRIKIQELGPNTQVDSLTVAAVQNMGLEADGDLQSALAGVTPYESDRLDASRTDVMAWSKGEDLLLRTKLNVFSPEVQRVEAGQNGFKAYRVKMASRVLASDEGGKVVTITLGKVSE